MLKDEFMKKISSENINLDRLDVVIGRVTNIPFSLGCYEENDIWKIYKVGERQNFRIVLTGSEDIVFDKMYNLIKAKIEMINDLEKMDK